MQFFPTPIWIAISAEVAWQVSHGAAGISYALLNATMKREFARIFCGDIKTAPLQSNVNIARNATHTSDHLSDLDF